jgi:cation diffusion facilitator CzcD-associated flavoprotein CzcO
VEVATNDAHSERRILIIGAGFSGLCLGIHLRRAGIHSFTLLEKSDRIGGTWRENTYPGAACDVPAFAYCFSFEQKTDWSRKWAPQDEILAYMEHCFEKYEITPHVRFGYEVESARFDEEAGVWRVRNAAGETLEAEILVSGVGQLSRPFTPEIPGLEAFAGDRFHSAQWNHEIPLEGKRVAVIGNAASAVQFVPEIAKRAARVSVFQRSANWMFPKNDHVYSEQEKRRYGRHPWLAKLYRWWIWLSFEARFPLFRGNAWFRRRLEAYAQGAIDEVADPELRGVLVPDYPIGGKRILTSDDYYPALCEKHVDLVTAGIERVTPEGVLDREGKEHAADVLVLATGFETTHFLAPMELEGRGGRHLDADWKRAAKSYLGITTSGFPNFFMMYGPNTNLGHNSIIFMIECQTNYILKCIELIRAQNLKFIDLRPEALEAYYARLQRELARTVWSQTGKSWYKNEDGTITNNWSGTTLRYWWRTRTVDPDAYEKVPRAQRDRSTELVPPQAAAS